MKLKRLAEDFQVEEQIALPAAGGPFALYRLTKQSLGTLDAVDALLKRWGITRSRIAFAGLKDRHALTTQYITIQGGPRRGLSQSNLDLKYLGQTARAIHASDITANRFQLVLRDLSQQDIDRAVQSLPAIAAGGLPNYFDDQRFGSLGNSGEFIARPWCLGDYERALWLALADENVHDSPLERDQKRVLREHWNDWSACQAVLRHAQCSNIIDYLAIHPGDFRRALALVRQDLRSLWLAAFQSHLWNQILAALLNETWDPDQLTLHRIGHRPLPFFTQLDEARRQELRAAALPLPSARLHLPEGPLKALYDKVFAAEGIELRQIRVKYPRDSFFSKGDRAAVFQASNLEYSALPDELYGRRQKLILAFTLPRGSYATILVKLITGSAQDGLDTALEVE